MHTPTTYRKSAVWRVCVISAMGGLLFGYDWVVIGGARLFYEPFFDIDTRYLLKGFTASSALLGCLIGAWSSGMLSDRLGRKPMLLASGAFFLASAGWTALASDLLSFNAARILGGIGIGLASNLSPMYIAEVAPASRRGQFVSINQLTIVVGVLAAQLVNLAISQGVPGEASREVLLQSWYGQSAWRWMFAAEAIPALAFFVLMWLVPESPRWLAKMGRWDAAHHVLRRLRTGAHADEELQQIRQSLLADTATASATWRDLLAPSLLPMLTLGIVLAVFQQWCGINVIFYYAPEIFTAAGQSIDETFASIAWTGSVNLVATLVALPLVDRLGRRPLMLFGAGSLTVVYTILGTLYYLESQGPHMVALVLVAIACYAVSLAPVTWVLISEIFPNRLRGAAISVSVLALWAACALLAFAFPKLNEVFGTSAMFGLFALVCASAWWYLLRRLPETRGRSLEEIERSLDAQYRADATLTAAVPAELSPGEGL